MAGSVETSEILDTIRDGLLVLAEDLTVVFASRGFARRFRVAEDETVGKKLYDLGNHQWDIPRLRELLEKIVPEQSTIEDYRVEHDFPALGRRVMRLNARHTHRAGNGSRHILLAIEDVTHAHDLEREVERQRRVAQGIVDTVREPLLVLDGATRVLEASRSFCRTFRVAPEETIGRPLAKLGNGEWDIPELKTLLERVISDDQVFEDFVVEHTFASIGRRIMYLNARRIYREGNHSKTLLLAIEDRTERHRLEQERQAALDQSRSLLDELNHRVMNSLSMIGAIMALEARHMTDEECKAAFGRVQRRVMAVGDLYKTLSGQGAIDTVPADAYLTPIAEDVVRSVSAIGESDIMLRCDIDPVPLTTRMAVPLGLVVNELVTNALKHAFHPDAADAAIEVRFSPQGANLRLAVTDNGSGTLEQQPRDSGVGSRLVDTFAAQLGGELKRASSTTGTAVTLVFPDRP